MSIWIYVGIIVLMLVFAKVLAWPLKLIIKLVINIILGGIIIYLVNLFGTQFGVSIPFNEINAVIVGLLGIPGAILVIIFNRIF